MPHVLSSPARTSDDLAEPVAADPRNGPPDPPVRLTPDGHVVEPGAVAQGFPQPWPDLRVEAVYVTVNPDTFRGRVLCGGVELGSTTTTDSEPEAIRLAEASVIEAVSALFRSTPASA